MEFALLALLLALIAKITDFIKYVKAGQYSAVVTQLLVWGFGIVLVTVAANADLFSDFKVNDTQLSTVNGASLALVGLALGSAASFGFDLKKAIDGSDSAQVPPL